ncbi:MAG: hypothetical protein ACQ9MH_17275 [Nitrospinales bacterium]
MKNEDCHGVAESEAGLSNFNHTDCFELRLGKPGGRMKGLTYVYILISKTDATRRYTGLTEDLDAPTTTYPRSRPSFRQYLN